MPWAGVTGQHAPVLPGRSTADGTICTVGISWKCKELVRRQVADGKGNTLGFRVVSRPFAEKCPVISIDRITL